MSKDATREYLSQFLEYDSKSGQIYWKARPAHMFRSSREATRWNNRYAGTVAGSENTSSSSGYKRRQVTLNGNTYVVHRIAWVLSGRDLPDYPEVIDHIDGNATNNKLDNLRVITFQRNLRNAKKRANNTSGVCGVCLHKASGKWHATIGKGAGGKGKSLGYYYDKFEAICVRKSAESKHHYSVRRGK